MIISSSELVYTLWHYLHSILDICVWLICEILFIVTYSPELQRGEHLSGVCLSWPSWAFSFPWGLWFSTYESTSRDCSTVGHCRDSLAWWSVSPLGWAHLSLPVSFVSWVQEKQSDHTPATPHSATISSIYQLGPRGTAGPQVCLWGCSQTWETWDITEYISLSLSLPGHLGSYRSTPWFRNDRRLPLDLGDYRNEQNGQCKSRLHRPRPKTMQGWVSWPPFSEPVRNYRTKEHWWSGHHGRPVLPRVWSQSSKETN